MKSLSLSIGRSWTTAKRSGRRSTRLSRPSSPVWRPRLRSGTRASSSWPTTPQARRPWQVNKGVRSRVHMNGHGYRAIWGQLYGWVCWHFRWHVKRMKGIIDAELQLVNTVNYRLSFNHLKMLK